MINLKDYGLSERFEQFENAPWAVILIVAVVSFGITFYSAQNFRKNASENNNNEKQ